MFQVFSTTGLLIGIDDEPEYLLHTKKLIVASEHPDVIAKNLPLDWYADRRAGHVVFTNMPEPMWDGGYEQILVEVDTDEEIDALFQAYNNRSY